MNQEATIVVDRDRPSLTVLYLDGRPSSAHDDDPTYLSFPYMEHMRLLVRARVSPGSRLRALHLGAAACTLPRALDAEYPNSRQLAVEPDENLARHVRDWFDLPRSPLLKIRQADGRSVLEAQAGRGWDIITRDAFIDGNVPADLRTIEAAAAAKEALSPTGAYILNSPVADRADLAAILETFPHVIDIASPAVLTGKHKGNLTIGAALTPWPKLDSDVARLRDLARVTLPRASAKPDHDPVSETAGQTAVEGH